MFGLGKALSLLFKKKSTVFNCFLGHDLCGRLVMSHLDSTLHWMGMRKPEWAEDYPGYAKHWSTETICFSIKSLCIDVCSNGVGFSDDYPVLCTLATCIKLMLVLMIFVQNDQSNNIFSFLLFLCICCLSAICFLLLLMQDQAGWCSWFLPPCNAIAELVKGSYSLV